jgi:hypothetical protein
MRSVQVINLLILNVIIYGCVQQPEVRDASFGWKAVYKHDENGQVVDGTMDDLIEGIRKGYNVRVGWGWEKKLGDSLVRLEHMAEPVFLTIIQEKQVSVVIEAHPLLSSYIDIENQTIGEGSHTWQCVLTTQGEFNAQVHHRATGELIKNWPQRQRMTWFLDYPSTHKQKGKPLFR